MAITTTVEHVRELLVTKLTDGAIMHGCITPANVMIEAHLLTFGHSAAVLAQIEKYLALHFAAMAEEGGALISETVDDASNAVANVYEAGLASTRFGQQALMFDVSGILVALGKTKLKAQFRVV